MFEEVPTIRAIKDWCTACRSTRWHVRTLQRWRVRHGAPTHSLVDVLAGAPVLDGADGRHLLEHPQQRVPRIALAGGDGYWKAISGKSVASAMRLKCATAMSHSAPS